MIPDVYPKTHGRIIGAFIAGGYAVSPALASDIDVWVQVETSVHPNYLERVKQDILAYLTDQYGLDMVKPLDDGREQNAKRDDYETIFDTLKVAMVAFGGFNYHVMVTSGSVYDVINSFDLSICQVGIDELGLAHRGEDYTKPFEPIVVVKDTPTTYDRMQKYMERFNVQGDAFYTMKVDARRQTEQDAKEALDEISF